MNHIERWKRALRICAASTIRIAGAYSPSSGKTSPPSRSRRTSTSSPWSDAHHGCAYAAATTASSTGHSPNPTFRVLLKLERGLATPLSELIAKYEELLQAG